MGIFGAIGRETKGAMRSIQYDLRHSRRFRRAGAIVVLTVAGGVLTAGTMLRGPVPELMGIETDQDGSGVTGDWFWFGSDTRGQDPEPPPAGADDDRTEPGEGQTAAISPTPAPTTGEPEHERPADESAAGAPGLQPVEQSTGTPAHEETGAAATTAPSPSPTAAPASTEQSQSPAPTESPTPGPAPSTDPTGSASPSE